MPRGLQTWSQRSSSSLGSDSASSRRSSSTKWTSTCPRHTCASETTGDVSWTFRRGLSASTNENVLIVFGYFSSDFTAPIGSISSMEVNVDLLDQVELIDLSDPDPVDVFFSSVGEEGLLSSPLPGIKTIETGS